MAREQFNREWFTPLTQSTPHQTKGLRCRDLLFFFYIVVILNTPTEAQWYQTGSPTANDINDVYFSDSLNGWLASDDGIFRSTNGGISWQRQDSGRTHALAGLGEWECWSIGNMDTLLHTINGGSTWEKKSLGNSFGLDSIWGITEVFFIDSLRGYVGLLGWRNGNANYELNIVKTSDGGSSWSRDSLSGNNVFARFPIIQFVDSTHGWIMGSNLVRTSDGGFSWDSIYTGEFGSTFDLQFASQSIGWRIEEGPVFINSLYRSIDGGMSWTISKSFQYSSTYSRLWFTDTSNGWATSYGALNGLEIWNTFDGGEMWVEQDAPISFGPSRIFFTDKSHGWIVGTGGGILRTVNGGVTDVPSLASELVPKAFSLHQNYPNPFNTSNIITFELPTSCNATLAIFDLLGHKITTLVDEPLSPGEHEIVFDAYKLGSGLYFYSLETSNFFQVKKLFLIK